MFDLKDLKIRRRTWIQIANVPKARLGWTLDDCRDVPQEALEALRSYLKRVGEGKVILAPGSPVCGRGVLFYGEPGHGKTTLALSMIQEMMLNFPLEAFSPLDGRSMIRPCYFMTFNDLIDLKGRLIGDEGTPEDQILLDGVLGQCKDDAYNIRVLIVDDVGRSTLQVAAGRRLSYTTSFVLGLTMAYLR